MDVPIDFMIKMQYHMLKLGCKFFTDGPENEHFHSLGKFPYMTNIHYISG